MNIAKFFNTEEITVINELKKAGKMSLSDIRLIVKAEMQKAYNNLLNGLYNRDIIHDYEENFTDNIIYRDTVESIIELYNIPCIVFSALLQEGYISVCGRGYIFNLKPVKLTEEEYKRLEYINWDLGIII